MGSKKLMERAVRIRKVLGGGMRQVLVLDTIFEEGMTKTLLFLSSVPLKFI